MAKLLVKKYKARHTRRSTRTILGFVGRLILAGSERSWVVTKILLRLQWQEAEQPWTPPITNTRQFVLNQPSSQHLNKSRLNISTHVIQLIKTHSNQTMFVSCCQLTCCIMSFADNIRAGLLSIVNCQSILHNCYIQMCKLRFDHELCYIQK